MSIVVADDDEWPRSPFNKVIAKIIVTLNIPSTQCDQNGRLIGLCGNFSKPVATISLPKSPTFLGNFCKGVQNL